MCLNKKKLENDLKLIDDGLKKQKEDFNLANMFDRIYEEHAVRHGCK